MMEINKLTRISHRGGAAAGGTYTSRPPAIYRPSRDYQINLLRHGSVVKKSPYQLEQSHRVTLSEARGLSRSAESSFASLRMKGLTLSVGEELSRSFEPCLNKLIEVWVGGPINRRWAR